MQSGKKAIALTKLDFLFQRCWKKVLPKRCSVRIWKLEASSAPSHWKLLRKSSLNMLFHHIGYMFNVPAEPVCSLWFCGSNYLQRGAFQATGPGYRYTVYLPWEPTTSILRRYHHFHCFGVQRYVLFCTVQVRIFGAHLSDTLSCFPMLQAGCFYSPTGLSLKDVNRMLILAPNSPKFLPVEYQVCSTNFKVEI